MSAPDAARRAELLERRRRAFEHIRQWGDPILKTPTRPVEAFDASLRTQAGALADLMAEAQGVGLAAPQAGFTRRLLVYRPESGAGIRALVNPEVVEASDEVLDGLEGCLSLGAANIVVPVPRASGVVVLGRDVDGEEVRIEAEADHARILQHEIDHLDGVLMLDRTVPEHRRAAVRALREGRPYRPAPPAPGDEPEHEIDA